MSFSLPPRPQRAHSKASGASCFPDGPTVTVLAAGPRVVRAELAGEQARSGSPRRDVVFLLGGWISRRLLPIDGAGFFIDSCPHLMPVEP